MEFNQFHFANPLWLLASLAIPLVWAAYYFFYKETDYKHSLENFVDSHLLPFLLMNKENKNSSRWRMLLIWAAAWVFLTLALAGPRWDFKEIDAFSKDQSLVILLDLSKSMNTNDIKPSRLAAAKQKIEDLLHTSKGVKVGLVAFAADPHMIAPLTDDKETILHLLPSLDTDLVYVQGSRLSPSLEMAANMLKSEPGSNKAILVISDGGFEDSSAMLLAKRIGESGIAIHAMGAGTIEGAPVHDSQGALIKKNGAVVISKLEKERLQEISKFGKGYYLEANYGNDHEQILKELEKKGETQMALGKKSRIWEEKFYLLLLPAIPILLYWFRNGFLFACIVLFPALSLHAELESYFMNSEQAGKRLFDAGNFTDAANSFRDPYRQGVSLYKAGKYDEAEKAFRQSKRQETACSAAYNLGNCLALQQKWEEAITAYETVLESWPDHTRTKENLELIKKMLEEKKKEPNQEKNKDKQQDSKDRGQEEEKESSEDTNSDNQRDSEKDRQNQESSNNGSQNQEQPNEPDSAKDQNQPKQEGEKPKEQNKDPSGAQEEQSEESKSDDAKPPKEKAGKPEKSETDQEADLLLNRINNDPKSFLKNKFSIESKKNGTTEGMDPW